MFLTKIDRLENYDGTSLVIMLGRCEPGPDVSQDKVIRFPDADEVSFSVIRRLNPALLRDGVTLLVSSLLAQEAFPFVRRVQKQLSFAYVKYVWFSKQDTATPDPFGLGHDKGPLADLVYKRNTLENLPYLMASPRAKVIARTGISLPALALSPGPSLVQLRPHLKMLSQRFLIICISRSLEFCHACGVVPDVVVQLDTHPEQAVFYRPDMDFSRSWLFMLSSAPVNKYAHRFAGTFAIDTFYLPAFTDDYNMRCSWLSSLIPTLGAVELFSPATALLAGADLSYNGGKYYHPGGVNSSVSDDDAGFDRVAETAAVKDGVFPARLVNGKVGETSLQFMATAFEAEIVAKEMRAHAGARFFNVTRAGILDPEVFPPAHPEDFLDAPKLDRQALRKAMTRAARDHEDFNQGRVGEFIHFSQKNADMILPQARIIASGDTYGSQASSQLLSAGKLLTHLHPVSSIRDNIHLCLKVVEGYQGAAAHNAALLRLDDMTSKGQSIAVLGLTDELKDLCDRLSKKFPKGVWQPYYTWGTPAEDSWRRLHTRDLPNFISSHPILLASERFLEACDYLFSLLPKDRVLSLEKTLTLPWPGLSSSAS